MTKWRAANKVRLDEYQKTYNQQNAERKREYAKHRRSTEEGRAYIREWERTHGADKAARRRARIAGVTTEPVDRNAIIKRDKVTCYLCNTKLKWREVTLDHVIPLARGGSHTAANLRVACGPCNFSKQHRLLATLPLGI
jgi:5-methylcytosine-specific restriction endonuclease McrA